MYGLINSYALHQTRLSCIQESQSHDMVLYVRVSYYVSTHTLKYVYYLITHLSRSSRRRIQPHRCTCNCSFCRNKFHHSGTGHSRIRQTLDGKITTTITNVKNNIHNVFTIVVVVNRNEAFFILHFTVVLGLRRN